MPDIRAGPPLEQDAYDEWVHRAVFDSCKWSVSAGDNPILCRFPILIGRDHWQELGAAAEKLAAEAEAAERELLERPALHELLGLPKKTRLALARACYSPGTRYLRFDFHPTSDGPRISEGNCDVSGGLLEGSGLAHSLAAHFGLATLGDPAGALARALARRLGAGRRVGLLHLSIYTEDRQVVTYLGRRMQEEGLRAVLFDARQLRPSMRARVEGEEVPLDLVFRFFPADWFERLDRRTGWRELFASPAVCNPLSTVLTQSKRFPLTWASLATPCPTWRALLPETRDPRHGAGSEFVFKPALGHEGSGVSVPGVSEPARMRQAMREATRNPANWVAQQRFNFKSIETPDGPRFASVGVHVVDGRAAGAYARVSEHAIIDETAQDAVVLLEDA